MMTAWTVGQKVALNRNSVVTIDRVTPSGRAFVGDRQYNPDGRERGARQVNSWRAIPVGIEVLTPKLLERLTLTKRYQKARLHLQHATQNLDAWAREHSSFYTERVPDLAEIEQIERVAAAAVAALAVAVLPVKTEVAP